MSAGSQYTVGILLFDEVEVLDFAGPFEVFSVASRVAKRLLPDSPRPFHVLTVSMADGAVVARHGLRVLADQIAGREPAIDVLIVPGGVVTAELGKPETLDWIRATAGTAALTASVCTGAFLLARAGLLHGVATTHWEDIDDLQAMFPELDVQRDVVFTEQGNLLTSAGISAGLEMSFRIVARLFGAELARETARQMEYVPRDTGRW